MENNPTSVSTADIEASLSGMTAMRAIEKLSEVIAVARRGHTWSWIAQWLFDKGVKSQRGGGPLSTETLTNYFSQAKKKGLVDEVRVAQLVKELDSRVRIETLEKIGTEDALQLLLRSKVAEVNESRQSLVPATEQPPRGSALRSVEKSNQMPLLEGSTHLSSGPASSTALLGIVKKAPLSNQATFEDYRAAVAKNLSKPRSGQGTWLVVAGRQTIVDLRLQHMIANGTITDMEGLNAAKSKLKQGDST